MEYNAFGVKTILQGPLSGYPPASILIPNIFPQRRHRRLLSSAGQAPEAALHELSCEVAEKLEQAAQENWLWKGQHHAKLIDGFTFTMPDTPENT